MSIFSKRELENSKISVSFVKGNNYDYSKIVENTKKTYYIYSPLLSPFADNSSKANEQLKELYSRGVDIILCMMDPLVIIQNNNFSSSNFNSCKSNFVNNNCIIKNNLPKIFDIFPNDKNQKSDSNSYFINSMKIPKENYEQYINQPGWHDNQHLIKNILKSIKNNYVYQNDETKIQLILTNRFIPFCITISDINQDNGMCIIDFNLPCTSHKIYIEIDRENNPEEFGNVCESFNKMLFSNSTFNECNKDYCKIIEI